MKKKNLLVMGIVCIVILLTCGCEKSVDNRDIEFKMGGETYKGTFSGVMKKGKPDGDVTISVISEDGEWTYRGPISDGVVKKGEVSNYPYEIQYLDKKVKGVYTGTLVDGVPDETGEFVSADEKLEFTYKGAIEKAVIKGVGHLEMPNYTATYLNKKILGTYDGEVLDGIANGKGKFVMNKAKDIEYEYDGEWKNGVIVGTGKLKQSNFKVYYIGKYQVGEYIGDIKNHAANGNGKFVFKDDIFTCDLEGTWVNNKITGKIKYKYGILNISGTVKNSIFCPTKLEAIKFLEVINYIFTKSYFNQEAIKFVEKHENLFMVQNVNQLKSELDTSLTFNSVVSSNSYGKKLMRISNATVLYAEKAGVADQWGMEVTMITMYDQMFNMYIVYCPDEVRGLYTGKKVDVYGVPAQIIKSDEGKALIMIGSLVVKK